MAVTESRPPIFVDIEHRHEATMLIADGLLDSSTYLRFRDVVIKAALDEPRAVIVDVNRLSVPSPSAWSVFTSARWHVSTWPDVPIILTCSSVERRRAITSTGVARYVPVHPSGQAALDAADELVLRGRRRARARLSRDRVSIRVARAMIHDWLTSWSNTQLIPVANTVATVFLENVLDHTESAPVLIVEYFDDTVTIAVEDCSQLPAARHEDADVGADIVSGLAIVSALCRAWGSTPTSSGKTVWALVGSENRL
jgi:hypothetical protein